MPLEVGMGGIGFQPNGAYFVVFGLSRAIGMAFAPSGIFFPEPPLSHPAPIPGTSAAELGAALDQFRKLIDPQMLAELQPVGPASAYAPWVAVWLLAYQRLNRNATLEAAVAELIQSVEAFSPTNERAWEGTLSSGSGASSRSRSRLRVEVADAVSDQVSRAVAGATSPSWSAFLLDGTTVALSSPKALRARWPAGRRSGFQPVPPSTNCLLREAQPDARVRTASRD